MRSLCAFFACDGSFGYHHSIQAHAPVHSYLFNFFQNGTWNLLWSLLLIALVQLVHLPPRLLALLE